MKTISIRLENSTLEAFARLEASGKASAEAIEYDADR